MSIILNRNTKIISNFKDSPTCRAVAILERDLKKVCMETPESGSVIRLEQSGLEPEQFWMRTRGGELVVEAGDGLGFCYALLQISREVLGIHNFWFWNDQEITPRERYELPEDYQVQSTPYAVKYRGWFVNDEVLLNTWSVNRRPEEAWEMVFEALLRCGGNLVIPGTDKNSKKYAGLASEMGLIITHHHAEPLGAEMFARAYPGLWPSYQEYPEKFQGLWRDAIQRQKGQKVLWNIGFRGQGDRPFWEDDPRYATPEARGALMSSLIRMQYDLVKESDPDAELCTNLYGETMELYQEGCLKLPEDVIKIWADNGFGKMVTRRQGNHNPRIPALPKETDGGRHGLYYHVSFYDLQAANHITMLPNPPEFVGRELEEALRRGVRDYWIINCSNVKPHVYYLDYVAEIWKTGKADAAHQLPRYVETYYGKEQAGRIAKDFRAYWDAMTFYGEHEDERCGEQFANHVARMLACQYMKNAKERCEDLLWATAEETLSGQVDWYLEICRTAKERCQAYWRQCAETAAALQGKTQRLYEDSLLLQAKIHYGCFLGAYETAKSLLLGLDGDYKKAFYHAGKARKAYQTANAEMRSREHGKWHGFYENECLADIRQSAWVLAGLMNHFRVLGDGPHFYEWKREFLYSEEDRRVMLILTMENHMEDEELFALMEEKWEDESDE